MPERLRLQPLKIFGVWNSKKATRDKDLQNLKWVIFGLSNGETPLDGRPNTHPEGAQLRMIGIPVPGGSRGGIFNRLELSENQMIKKTHEMADATERTITANCGTAIPVFLEKVIDERERMEIRAVKLIKEFIESVRAVNTPGERRLARKFAIMYAAAMNQHHLSPRSK